MKNVAKALGILVLFIVAMQVSMASGRATGNDTVQTGSIVAFAGATLPTNYVACDGASLDRSTFAALFSTLGTTWGAVDGSHFNVPDCRGRGLLGAGSGPGLTARTLGDNGVGQEDAVLVSHDHSFAQPASTGRNSTAASGNYPGSNASVTIYSTTVNTLMGGGTTGVSGASGVGMNMQPSAVVVFGIKD